MKKGRGVGRVESIVGSWGGEVLAGSEEDGGQSDDVLDEVEELAVGVLSEHQEF